MSLDPPGRFLKQDHETKMWSEMEKQKIFEKIRQALREGVPDILDVLKPLPPVTMNPPMPNFDKGAQLQNQSYPQIISPPADRNSDLNPLPLCEEGSSIKLNNIQITTVRERKLYFSFVTTEFKSTY